MEGAADVITAWNIYWVMQLDSINRSIIVLMVVAGAASLISAMIGSIEDVPAAVSFSKKAAAAFVGCILLGALTPSTKTAAAMIVLPAVANNQAIQREASDLYGIAKDALREIAKPKEDRK